MLIFFCQEFWLGLDNMFYVTNARKYRLRVKLTDVNGKKQEYDYGRFKIMVRSLGVFNID